MHLDKLRISALILFGSAIAYCGVLDQYLNKKNQIENFCSKGINDIDRNKRTKTGNLWLRKYTKDSLGYMNGEKFNHAGFSTTRMDGKIYLNFSGRYLGESFYQRVIAGSEKQLEKYKLYRIASKVPENNEFRVYGRITGKNGFGKNISIGSSSEPNDQLIEISIDSVKLQFGTIIK